MKARKILSVIGNISTGKSSFLNYLLGSDILQTGDGLKTRFIVIIRHTENHEPVLSHITRERTAYEDFYTKVQDSEGKLEYKGKKEIIKKINSLNNVLKKVEDEGKLDYSKHLYLLETRIKNIHNEDFLNYFDLADIPGLNNASKKGDGFGSIKAIFTPLKGLIQYGFLIFDANQYEDNSVLEILKQLMSEEEIKINHFLIILNKIDQIAAPKRGAAFLRFKAYLNYHLGDDLLNDTNSIITMNSLKLLEEENVMENFDNFLSYHFKELTIDTYEKYFKRLVAYGYYMNNKSAPRKKYSDIEKMINPDTELDEDFSEHISKIAENVGLKLNFDPDEENYENICKLFSLLQKAFLQKNIYFYRRPSEYRQKIDEFFDKKDFISLDNNIKEKEGLKGSNKYKNKIVNEQLLKCMEKLQSFYRNNIKDLQSKRNKTGKKEKNVNIETLGERMENLEKLIACHDKIRITVYGTYNAGKSSTLNSFIGKNLLQVDDEQCTGKPILIRYLRKDEKPKIYRAELKTIKDYDKFSHYGFVEKGEALAEGDEAVRNFISSQNIFVTYNYKQKTGKTDDFFILKTPIKILDELDLSEEIKNNVEFLDTPGLNTELMKNEQELLSKLIEQTFIYFFIIDPKVGGADTAAFKDILENTMLKTIYNRSIINESKTFPYLFICNKCDNEKIDFNLGNCNTNINLILRSKNEKFDIIKFSAYKRMDIINKMNEYTPENFIEKVENNFFDVLYFNSKTFYDYLDDYILKDFKKNFNGILKDEFKADQLIKDKIVEILKKKNYEISNDKEKIISKLSGYLSFCNKNFNNLKIADNIMMDELKNKIKSKINLAYEHIKNGYKIQVQTALQFIENFIKIGVIPDSCKDRTKEEEIKKAEKILAKVKKILEINNIPEALQKFRENIKKELESNEGLDYDYNNYEEILKKKQNFINENFKQLSTRTINELNTKIQEGIIKIIRENVEGIEISFDKGKMTIKENPSMKDTAKKVTGLLGLAGVGAGIAFGVGTVALEDAIFGGLLVGLCAVEPQFIAITALSGIASEGAIGAGLLAALTPVGWFGLLALGAGVTVGGLICAASHFSERKKNAYYNSIENIKEKFYSLYDGYEKKVIKQYNAMKENILERAASFLDMCYYPVELDESQKESLLNKFDDLKREIMALISK